jgi:hypothetical protein
VNSSEHPDGTIADVTEELAFRAPRARLEASPKPMKIEKPKSLILPVAVF